MIKKAYYSVSSADSEKETSSTLNSDEFNKGLYVYYQEGLYKNSTAKHKLLKNNSGTSKSKGFSNHLPCPYNLRKRIKKTDYSSENYYTPLEENFTDLNNNLPNDSKITYSYMKQVAIYGVPTFNLKKTYSKLLSWYIYSFIYDLKYFIQLKKNFLIIIFLFHLLYLLW